MVPPGNLAAFALASVALIAVPGPSVLFVIGRSLVFGRLGGLLSVLGNSLGLVPVVAAVAFGLGAIVTRSAVIFTIVKFAGAAYIVYLGVHAIRTRRRTSVSAGVPYVDRSRWRLVSDGFVVGVTNPKSLVFFVAVLPQFVSYPAGAVPLQLVSLGLVFIVLALLGDSTWALAAGSARAWFARSSKRIEHLSAGGGVLMIGLGGILAATGPSS